LADALLYRFHRDPQIKVLYLGGHHVG
jgi:hypothetical protein